MKKLSVAVLMFFLGTVVLRAQSVGLLTYSGGVWSPAVSTSASNPVGNVSEQVRVYCYNTGLGKWVPGDSSCFGGGGGSGTVSGQAAGVIPLATAATVIGAQSHLDDGVTTGSTITSSEPVAAPTLTATNGGSGQGLDLGGSTSGSAHLAAAAIAGTPATLLLPTVDPTAGQQLAAVAPASCSGYQTANCVQLYWTNGNPPVFTDTFVGTNGTQLYAHTSDSGNAWIPAWFSSCSQGMTLNGSGGIVSTTSGNCASYTSNWLPPSADYTVEATCVTAATGICGLASRATNSASQNGYFLFFSDGTGAQLFKAVAGSFTQIGSTYAGVTTGSHVLALTTSGTTISASIDGTPRITGTDSAFSAAGVVGVYLLNPSANVAVFSGMTAH